MPNNHIREMAVAVLKTEAEAIARLMPRIDDNFVRACLLMLDCEGRIVVTGMGKSGHIGNKMAATLASTGTPAFFMHPGEASHGDLGMITPRDVVIALSSSGVTQEIICIVPLIKRLGVPLICMTGNGKSELAREANVHIDISVEKEACPLGLAPTASTTAALAMGDALAIALLDRRGFTQQDFARSHPGGRLGRRLLLHVRDIMHTDDAIPAISPETNLSEAVVEITRAGIGVTAIVDAKYNVMGIFTDGDLRRWMNKKMSPHQTVISDVMTTDCITVNEDMLAAESLRIMEEKKINALLVTDKNNRLIGALNMHTLLKAGVA